MFWFHFFNWATVILGSFGLLNIVPTIIFRKEGFMLLFILGCVGAVLCMMMAEENRPIPLCTTSSDSTVQWRQHREGRYPDWWVYVPVQDSAKYCEVHDQALYNMGIGYKLNKTYQGVLVERP